MINTIDMTKKTVAIMLLAAFSAFISAGSSGSDEPIGREDVLQGATTSGIEERGDSLIAARAEVGEEGLPVVEIERQIPAIIETEESRLAQIIKKVFEIDIYIYGGDFRNMHIPPTPKIFKELLKIPNFLKQGKSCLAQINANRDILDYFIRIAADPENPEIRTPSGNLCKSEIEISSYFPYETKLIVYTDLAPFGRVTFSYVLGEIIYKLDYHNEVTWQLVRNGKNQEGDFNLIRSKKKISFNMEGLLEVKVLIKDIIAELYVEATYTKNQELIEFLINFCKFRQESFQRIYKDCQFLRFGITGRYC